MRMHVFNCECECVFPSMLVSQCRLHSPVPLCLTGEDYQKFTLLCRFILSPSDRWRGRAKDERGTGAMEERHRSLPGAAPKHQESLKVMT